MMQKAELRNISREIAQEILDAKIPGMDDRSASALQAELDLVIFDDPRDERWFNVHANYLFDRDQDRWRNSNVELSVALDAVHYNSVEDPETGDFYHDYKINVKIVWPSCSSDPMLNDLADRLDLQKNVLALAQSISVKHARNQYRVLAKTKAEHEAEVQKKAQNELLKKVHERAASLVKSMRVYGSERIVARDLFTGLADGTYECKYTNSYDTKIYKVTLNPYRVRIIRTQ